MRIFSKYVDYTQAFQLPNVRRCLEFEPLPELCRYQPIIQLSDSDTEIPVEQVLDASEQIAPRQLDPESSEAMDLPTSSDNH